LGEFFQNWATTGNRHFRVLGANVREGPALLAAFAKLHHRPDLVMFDGHGLAHPRRFGLASHHIRGIVAK
jgi:hypothetical protein